MIDIVLDLAKIIILHVCSISLASDISFVISFERPCQYRCWYR